MGSTHLIKPTLQATALTLAILSLGACASNRAAAIHPHPDSQAALEYLKALEGQWVVQGGTEGPLGWKFGVTSRDGVVVERLKVGAPTEMTTVYHLADGSLFANHFCQLANQPRLTAVSSQADGDLHFLCNGDVGNTQSHDELHMHGVHFKKHVDTMTIWMDMFKDGEVAFETSYTIIRVEPDA
jgi:hypothetical protein